ncbi:hypothetical protein [Streptomyces phaeochromogenes]|uniref:hypothetical protein n=1 Tax=Streptomyces phaeochromogenes TaxID=1923 RepID=UPI0027D83301|nr:hypothetical protein [Streptomyces phaeochromogenes]
MPDRHHPKGGHRLFRKSEWLQSTDGWIPVSALLPPDKASVLWWERKLTDAVAAIQGADTWLVERIIRPMITELLTMGTWYCGVWNGSTFHAVLDSPEPAEACHALMIFSSTNHVVRYGATHADRQCPVGPRSHVLGDPALQAWRDMLRAAVTSPALITQSALGDFAACRGQTLTDESTGPLYVEAAHRLQTIDATVAGMPVGTHRFFDGSMLWKIRQDEGRCRVALGVRMPRPQFRPPLGIVERPGAIRNVTPEQVTRLKQGVDHA